MGTDIEWTPKARAVLAAANELFYAQGIHAVGVDAIAARAGVTKKTLYDRFGSKERLVVEYLAQRDQRWRAFLAPRLEAAGPDPRARLAAVFDASADWAAEEGGKGCSTINAHAEISQPDHPAYASIVGQKRWMLDLFTDIAGAAGAADAQATARSVMLLHEGALVTDGMRVIDEAYARARDLALSLLTTP
ncbi:MULTISPECIES: TetR/AcrR family transcriptional regulator [Actinoalloteichus]|uniref:Transcriptional regulator, TetR family n=1 Tax=Actinoalloteichus caeruleus DSM 43889 TaxID=1120930 RepID=A0ABT1JF83_ACTCY|nr:TetR/AcrR family transcriptional regulator [Actinoalloteichus caeruleus]MCP2330838.1 transcriptional regulator, TetR family [Actinoalloteichus caeruleus DSM 43889]